MVRIIDNDEDTGRTLRMEWDSVSDAVDGLDGEARNPVNADQLREAACWWGTDMADSRTRAWLLNALEHGDEQTLRDIARMRERVEERSPEFRREQKRRKQRRGLEAGDDINIDRYLAYNPMMWDRVERQPTHVRTIVIGVEVGVLGNRVRADLLPRGAAVCALADWLVEAGYSVEVRAIWHSRDVYAQGKNTSGIGSIVVKPANTPLDISAIATACCEIAFARCVLLRSRIMHAANKVASGLGYTTDVPSHVHKALGIDIAAPASILTEEAAAEWLTAAVRKLAGEEEVSA